MSFEFNKHTFTEVNSKLKNVEDWFHKIRLTIQGTRFQNLRQGMERIAGAFENRKLKELQDEWGDERVVTTLVESMPFLIIYDAFKDENAHFPIQKLKDVISQKGPFFARHESVEESTNHARNTLFELELAARLKVNGINVTGFDDLDFDFDNANFNIQCKRPMTRSSIGSNVSQAAEQLSKRLNRKTEDQQPRGFIALGVDKVMNADKVIVRRDTSNQLNILINNKINSFVRRYETYWKSFVDTRILGVIIYLKYVAMIKETEVYSAGTQLIIRSFPHHILQAVDYNRITMIGKKLGCQNN